ncbi:hypothetical protein KC867_02420 [Candidatus Saccharibacteria bacterium]|nr:hypothetical protein [Candidatus Saccharibacteria bacterium]
MEKSKQLLQKIKTSKVQVPAAVTPRYKLPVSLRTPRGERYYAQAKSKGVTRPLLDEPRIKEWQYWALIDNDFPYSGAFKVHHMLIPKRVVSRKDLNQHELTELDSIVDDLSEEYDCYLINFAKKQSIKNHYHIHFLIYIR